MPSSPKNTRFALNLLAVVVGMLLLAYASVPLYRLFCQATGYGGTPREALGTHAPGRISDRVIDVTFNADVAPGMPWQFRPGEHDHMAHIGEQVMTWFTAKNLTQSPITGRAAYNIVPSKAGAYFVKIQCFCFTEQTLLPNQEVNMPVLFYIDPSILKDREMDDVKTITLSYTFFKVDK